VMISHELLEPRSVAPIVAARGGEYLHVTSLGPRLIDKGPRIAVGQHRHNDPDPGLDEPRRETQDDRFRPPHRPRGDGVQHSHVAAGPQLGVMAESYPISRCNTTTSMKLQLAPYLPLLCRSKPSCR